MTSLDRGRRETDLKTRVGVVFVVVAVLGAAATIGASRTARDPDLAVRTAYVERVAAGLDAGAAFSLASSADVEFDRGWTFVAFLPGYSGAFRGATRQANVRLRTDGSGVPMRVRLLGWVPTDRAQGSQVLTYRVNAGPVASFQITTQEFEHVVRIPVESLPRGRGWVDLTIEASTWAWPDQGDRSFDLRAFVWERDDGE